MSCIGGFINTLNNSRGTWNFFLFSVAATWFVTMIAFLFFTLGAHKNCSSVNWALVVSFISFPYFCSTFSPSFSASILPLKRLQLKFEGARGMNGTTNNPTNIFRDCYFSDSDFAAFHNFFNPSFHLVMNISN